MTKLMTSRGWVLASVGLALGLAACTADQTGTPGGTSGNPASSVPASATTSAIAGLDACDLLTTQEAAQFKAQGPGKQQDTQSSGATSACGWLGRSSTDRSVSFAVLVRANQGVDDLQANGGQITTGKLNGRDARQDALTSGGCIVALKAGDRSRVDLSVVIGGVVDPTEACQIASNLGNIVEPKLPKYEG